VGVGFGGIGSSSGATMASAWALAIGIGLQNFPEGKWVQCVRAAVESSLLQLAAVMLPAVSVAICSVRVICDTSMFVT
jgi:zinc transporter ZupT